MGDVATEPSDEQSILAALTDLPPVLGPWPRTAATLAAVEFIDDREPRYLADHSIRSYFFGRALGEGRGLRAGEDYDDEVMFLGAVLHDIGLTPEADGTQRFEVDGADRAARFVRDQGMGEASAETVWDTVALHTSPGIVNRKRPEISLAAAGIAADILAVGADDLAPQVVTAMLARFPRNDLAERLTGEVASQIGRNPAKLVPFTFGAAALALRSPSTPQPTLADLIARASRSFGPESFSPEQDR